MVFPLTALLFLAIGMSAFAGEIYAQAKSSKMLNGRVLKSNGRPLAYTELELVPTESRRILSDTNLVGITLANGEFSFTNVPAGKYTLSINFDNKPSELSPYAPYFYPNSSTRASAKVFEINSATRIRGLSFKLPRELVARKVQVMPAWPDGGSLGHAFVGFRDVDYGGTLSYSLLKSDSNGIFVFSGFEGRRYQIAAFVPERFPRTPFEDPGAVIAAGESNLFVLESNMPIVKFAVRRTKEVRKLLDKYVAAN